MISLPGICPKELKPYEQNLYIYKNLFIAALFIIIKIWEQPKLTDERSINVVYPCNEILFGHRKEWSTDICCNMDKSWKYSKSKNWDTKGHILCDSTYMKYEISRKGKSVEIESWLVVSRGCRGKERERLLTSMAILFGWWNVLELNNGNCCTSLWIC